MTGARGSDAPDDPGAHGANAIGANTIGARPTGGGSPDPRGDARGPLLRAVRRPEVGFALVGAFNTAFGVALTVAWLAVLPEHWPPAVAVVLAYAIGIVTAFVLHRTLVFRVRGRVLRDFVGFVVVNSGGLLLNTVLLTLAVQVLHLPRIPSAVVVMGVVAVASFFGHRYISFRRPTADDPTLVPVPGVASELPTHHPRASGADAPAGREPDQRPSNPPSVPPTPD